MATEQELERLVVRLMGDGSSFQTMMKTAAESSQKTATVVQAATQQIQSMKEGLEGYAGTISKALGVIGVSTNLTSAFTAFDQAERNALRLNAAIVMNGGSADDMNKRYKSLADQLTATTLLGKGEVFGLARMAESMGVTGEKAEQLIRNSVALSGATDMSAESALHMLTAMDRGNVQMLRRVPMLRGIHDETELVNKVNQLMSTGMAQQEAIAKTAGGQLEKLGKFVAGLKKDVGGLVSEAIAPVVGWLTQAVDWFKRLDPQVRQVATVVILLTGAVLLLGPAISLVTTLWGPLTAGFSFLRVVPTLIMAIVNPIRLIGLAVSAVTMLFSPWGLLITAVVVAIRIAVDAMGGWQKAWEKVQEWANVAFKAIQFGFTNFRVLAEYVWTAVQVGFWAVWNTITHFFTSTLPTAAENLWSMLKDGWTNSFNWLSTVVQNLAGNVVRVLSNIPGLIAGSSNWDDLWVPLTQGFEAQFTDMRQFEDRELTMMERLLRNSLGSQGEAIADAWNSFTGSTLNLSAGRAHDAEQTGAQIGAALNKGTKKELDKLELAFSGSADAMHRLAAMRDRLEGNRPDTGPRSPGIGPTGGLGGGLGNIFGGLGQQLAGIWDSVSEAAEDFWQWLKDVAANAWSAITDFDLVGWLTTSFTRWWNDFIKWLERGFDSMWENVARIIGVPTRNYDRTTQAGQGTSLEQLSGGTGSSDPNNLLGRISNSLESIQRRPGLLVDPLGLIF